MKKLIALLGLAALGFYFLASEGPDPDIFLKDVIKVKKAAVKKIRTPLPAPTKKTAKTTKKALEDIPKEEIIEKILDSTSTSHSLKSIDYIINDRLKEAQTYLSPEQYAKLEKVLKKHFDGETIVKRITDHLAANLSDEEIRELKKRTEDPFLKKVWSLEEYANGSTGIAAFKEYMNTPDLNPPAPERVALIKKFDETVGGTESVVELNSALVRGILEGSNSGLPKGEKLRAEEIKEMTTVLADQIRDSIDSKVVKNLQFTYSELSDEDIRELMEKSTDGSFYKTNALIEEELKKILLEGGREIGKSKVHLN